MSGYVEITRLIRVATLIVAACFPLSAQAAAQRVASLSICTDQLLLSVANPEQISALSNLATVEEVSAYVPEAKHHPVHSGQIEELLALQADLILTDDWTPTTTRSMLKRLDIPTLHLPTATGLEDLPAAIEKLATALGQEQRGELLIRQWRGMIMQGQRDDQAKPLAALFRPNGYSPGLGTPQNSVIEASGMRNLSAELGLAGSQSLDLERFIYYRPVVWVKDVVPHENQHGQGEDLYRHAALRHTHIEEKDIPLNTWFCLTPRTQRAIEALRGSGLSFAGSILP